MKKQKKSDFYVNFLQKNNTCIKKMITFVIANSV